MKKYILHAIIIAGLVLAIYEINKIGENFSPIKISSINRAEHAQLIELDK